jgi:hypothetical protein
MFIGSISFETYMPFYVRTYVFPRCVKYVLGSKSSRLDPYVDPSEHGLF